MKKLNNSNTDEDIESSIKYLKGLEINFIRNACKIDGLICNSNTIDKAKKDLHKKIYI